MAAHRERGHEPLDLRTLDLAPGEARELEVPLAIGPLVIGGEPYRTEPAEPAGRLEVSQSASGRHFRLRFAAGLVGPCWRCLAESRIHLRPDVRDYAAFGRAAHAPWDEDLDCEYLEGDALDVSAMARDALVDLVPPTILCREECAGLCPTCGADLNAGSCSCPPPAGDSRWDALRDLASRLQRESS